MKLQGMAIGRLAGHLGFLLLIAMSIVLAPERVLFVDSAAQLFEMIQRGSFVIYDHRYTMAVTQLLPLAGIKLGLPLYLLVVLYSVAAPLLAYLVFLLLAYRVKDIPLALFLLLPLLCIRHTFFHAISESFSLMVYATLLLALLRHRGGNRWLHSLGVLLTTIACVFMHPIGLFFVVFLLGYHFVDSHCKPTVAFLVGIATLAVAAVVKMSLPSGHDADYMPSLHDVLFYLSHPSELKVVGHLFERMLDFYLYPLALYIVALVWHIRGRQWVRMAFCLAFNVGFFLMTAIVYRTDASFICVERAWLPLIFFAGVPVVCEIVPAQKQPVQRWALLLFMLALLLDFGKIADTSRHYHQRLERLQSVLDASRQAGQYKLVTDLASAKEQFDVQSWATAFETLILSSMHDSRNSATLYLEEEEPFMADNPDYAVEDAFLAVPWNRLWNYSTLNPRYFQLPLQRTEVIKISP